MDHSPVGYTCPTIDRIIDKMKSALNGAKYYIDHPINDELTYDMDSVLWYLNDAIDEIEEVRSDNAKLRDWGNELYDKVEELQSEISYLESQLNDCS